MDLESILYLLPSKSRYYGRLSLWSGCADFPGRGEDVRYGEIGHKSTED